jgi:type IV fimbrial biogenesis protein FimT
VKKAHRNLGYTLIESMLAVAIVGILSALALPSFAKMIQRQQTQTTRDGIFSLVQNARTIALANQQNVVLCGSADGVKCSSNRQWQRQMLSFVDQNKNRQPDGNDKMLVIVELNPQIAVHASRSMLVYKADGSARGTNLTIKVCSRAQPRAEGATVVVANSGRARMDRDECH